MNKKFVFVFATFAMLLGFVMPAASAHGWGDGYNDSSRRSIEWAFSVRSGDNGGYYRPQRRGAQPSVCQYDECRDPCRGSRIVYYGEPMNQCYRIPLEHQ